MYLSYSIIISLWKKLWPFIWTIHESPSPKDYLWYVWLKFSSMYMYFAVSLLSFLVLVKEMKRRIVNRQIDTRKRTTVNQKSELKLVCNYNKINVTMKKLYAVTLINCYFFYCRHNIAGILLIRLKTQDNEYLLNVLIKLYSFGLTVIVERYNKVKFIDYKYIINVHGPHCSPEKHFLAINKLKQSY